MPYRFSDEQRRLRETLRSFAREEVIPGAAERDRTGTYPAELVARLADLGLMGITIPEEYGGLGLDTPTQLVAIEEVAYGDAALATIYTGHYLGMEGFLLHGSEEQKRRYLAPLASGEQLAGFALTEPEAGSDVASIRTEARRARDRWVLRGSKVFISNAREAGLLVVFAKTDLGSGLDGISAFAVSTDSAGISFSPPQDKLGIRSAPTYEIRLEDVTIERDALIGGVGKGGRIALEVLNRARIDIAAMANGIAMRSSSPPTTPRNGTSSADRFATSRRSSCCSQKWTWQSKRDGWRRIARRNSRTMAPTSDATHRSPSTSRRRTASPASTGRCRSTEATATCARARSSASTVTVAF